MTSNKPDIKLSNQVERLRQRVDQQLLTQLAQLDTQPARLKQAMQYSLTVGGKRIRPVLTYLTGEMLGMPLSQLDPLALAVECIHAYSLIHDDLPAMDDDDLRRGQPTCHIAFDEATAILAGDSLQTLAFSLLTKMTTDAPAEQRLACVELLANAAGFNGMCGGQAIDLAATGQSISLSQLETLHRKKTGALIQAAVLMPALLSNQMDETITGLRRFADLIGLAFQVQDDILDIISDTETLGKPQGSDIEAGKSTYPALMGLEQAQQHASDLFEQALHALRALPYNSDNLQHFAGYLINRQK